VAHSTIPSQPPLERARRARTGRRAFVVVLCLFLLAGLLGLLGVRTATVRAEGGGYEMEVRYARVTRPGLAVPWAVTIRRPGGFAGPVTVASTSSYFDLFDENAFEPEPESVTTDGERVIWEFKVPEGGDTMEISLDTRTGPNVQWSGKRATTAILEGGRPVAQVRYETIVLP
jgi:hypothetical protein